MSKNGLRMVVSRNFDMTHLSPPSSISHNYSLAKYNCVKVSSLTSRRMVFGRTISSCADMVTQVSACEWNHKGYIFYYKLFFSVVIITDPTDSSISTIAVSISSASVTCSDDEVSSLKTLETDLETMEAAIDSALTAVQAALAGAEIIKYSFFMLTQKDCQGSIYINPLLSCHRLHRAHQLGHQQGEAQAEPEQHQDLAVAR